MCSNRYKIKNRDLGSILTTVGEKIARAFSFYKKRAFHVCAFLLATARAQTNASRSHGVQCICFHHFVKSARLVRVCVWIVFHSKRFSVLSSLVHISLDSDHHPALHILIRLCVCVCVWHCTLRTSAEGKHSTTLSGSNFFHCLHMTFDLQ